MNTKHWLISLLLILSVATSASAETYVDGVLLNPGSGGSGDMQITGTLSGKVGVITKAANYTLGTDSANEAYGYLVTMTATGEVTLPTAVAGMSVCVYSTTAAAVYVDVTTGDTITLDGTALTVNDRIDSASGAGDYICLVSQSANNWLTMGRSGVWTDGGLAGD